MHERLVTAMLVPGFIALITLLFFAAPSSFSAQDARAAFEAGQSAQERGDLSAAVRSYTTALASDPTLFQAYYQRAVALIGLGKDEAAEADLRKVIGLQPGFARARRALGQLLLDRGRTDEAKRELARAVELDPKLTGVRLALASALLKSQEPARAAEHLRAAIEQGEATALAYALMGVAGERMGKPEQAFADYSRAIEMDSKIALALEGRARLFEAKGELRKAVEDYTVAYGAQPSPELARKLAHLHSRAGQPQAAIHLYRRLLLEKPDDTALRAEMVRVMMDNGQADEAIKEADTLARLQPKNPEALSLAGDVYFKDKPEVAAEYYRRAMEADPSGNRFRVQLGSSLVRAQQYEAALPVLAEAITKEPDNYAAHANLATALFKLKQYPQAAREFVWVVRARPETAVSYYFLAISLDRLGDCEQAFRAYQEFVRRADKGANKSEVEEASIRLGLLQKLAKEGKCKSVVKGNGKGR